MRWSRDSGIPTFLGSPRQARLHGVGLPWPGDHGFSRFGRCGRDDGPRELSH